MALILDKYFFSHLNNITFNKESFIYIVHLDTICLCGLKINSSTNHLKRYILHTDFVKDFSLFYNITTNFLERFNSNFSGHCFMFKIDEKNIITDIICPIGSPLKQYFRYYS